MLRDISAGCQATFTSILLLNKTLYRAKGAGARFI